MEDKKKNNLLEFLRYAIVGGIASVVDIAVNYVFLHYVFGATKDDRLYVALATFLGFLFGLIVNFVLSNIFVFTTNEQREKGKRFSAFLISAAVGVVGLGLTELLMLLGTYIIPEGKIWYIILQCVVKCIVLIWNYLGRKIFVYRGR